jgi:hypothetical protein
MSQVASDPVLEKLVRFVDAQVASGKLIATLTSVIEGLAADPTKPQAWLPLDIDSFSSQLPAEIRSSWIFVLRSGGVFGSERHPNSHQRTVAIRGAALFEVFDGKTWQQFPLDGTNRNGRCVSIPPQTWHRIRIGPQDFVSLSFHTVPAAELIEETPVGDDLSVTRRRLYHDA